MSVELSRVTPHKSPLSTATLSIRVLLALKQIIASSTDVIVRNSKVPCVTFTNMTARGTEAALLMMQSRIIKCISVLTTVMRLVPKLYVIFNPAII